MKDNLKNHGGGKFKFSFLHSLHVNMLHIRNKDKAVSLQACRVNRGIAPPILNLETR